MAITFFWIIFAIAVGVWASNRGRSGIGWFLLSLVISPLLGFVLVAVSRDLRSENIQANDAIRVKCPACAELVLAEAVKCKHCGEPLTPVVMQTPPSVLEERRTGSIIAVIVFGLGALILIGVFSAIK